MQGSWGCHEPKGHSCVRARPPLLPPLLLLICLLTWCAALGEFTFPDQRQESFLRSLQDFQVVYPARVDASSRFLSHDLLYHEPLHQPGRWQVPADALLHYVFEHDGRQLHLNVTLNSGLLSAGYVLERQQGKTHREGSRNTCHHTGDILEGAAVRGAVAVSTCNSLTGVLSFSHGEHYFIEPVRGVVRTEGSPQPHVVYKHDPASGHHVISKRHALVHPSPSGAAIPGNSTSTKGASCGVTDAPWHAQNVERQRERWQRRHGPHRRIAPRSTSTERWVETLVVVDPKMVQYHGRDNIENYIFSIINMVSGLYHDASIGNPINIVLVRLIILEEDQEGLKIVHHADKTLASFCNWQKSLNSREEESNATRHDIAVLVTRKDLCVGMNRPCETLGLSHVSGMCQPHRSCNINEDTGLPLAFTVAHEMGHSFGIQHDGQGNDCEPVGKRPFIMSPQLLYDTSPLTWSRCSKEYITRFLDRGWGFCLDDGPAKPHDLSVPSLPPGSLYDVNQQCRLQYGPDSRFCDGVDDVCRTLWCTVGSTCHSKMDAAVEGTKCGEDKWCFHGECVTVAQRSGSINGDWGAWSSWSHCTRTCGVGVQSALRQCNNPTPRFGGRYCVGERKRYRTCNVQPCSADAISFRQMQCSEFNTVPYRSGLHEWAPLFGTANSCELHCRPMVGYFSEKMLDAVIDGTPCYEGNASRDVCIDGICKNVGCDYEIDSNAMEDRCGVCQGNGSSCETVKMTYEETEGLGYVDVGLIPEGARDIRVEEVAEASNFLALRSEDPARYFLNGDWVIQWNGDYKAAGTTFTYARSGNLENLTAPGPTMEPVWIQLLFQEKNPGIRYEYTIRKDTDSDNEIDPPELFWHYMPWSKCTVTCGAGVQRQTVSCLERTAGIVEEKFCNSTTRPDDRQRACNEQECPSRWWAGDWQKCSATCGRNGTAHRTVLCLRSIGPDAQKALTNSECQHLPKPKLQSPCNQHVPCPSRWVVGNWTECSVTCVGGGGKRTRSVECGDDAGATCDRDTRPSSESACSTSAACPIGGKEANSGGPLKKQNSSFPGKQFDGLANRGLEGDQLPIAHVTVPSFVAPQVFPSNNVSSGNDDYYVQPTTQSIENSVPNSQATHPTVGSLYDDYNFIGFQEDLLYDADTNDPIINGSKLPLVYDDELLRSSNKPLGEETTTTSATFAHSPAHVGQKWLSSESNELNPTGNPSTVTGGLVVNVEKLHNISSSSKSQNKLTRNKSGHKKKKTPLGASVAPSAKTATSTSLDTSLPPNGSRFFHPTSSFPTRPHIESTVSAAKNMVHPTQDRDPRWVVGNWSECSVTCGLGSMWRRVECNAGEPSLCTATKRPTPARRCHVQPCATWIVGEWTKCLEGCGGERRTREVLCVDKRDGRPLRPFHCQSLLSQPPDSMSCNTPPCLAWDAGQWSPCSRACGGGTQRRPVLCPKPGRCYKKMKPDSSRACNPQACAEWLSGPWGECSAACGGGVQRRLVKCVNATTRRAEDNTTLCEHVPRPDNAQKCNINECETHDPKHTCEKDRMSFTFCRRLKLLGRCQVATVRLQCCLTCHRDVQRSRPRGNEHVSK
ncbi:A disintegrin and metalloproteinase with thrombospondin motifs 7-like isoform X1 [Lethenteron reissneri]|uniref:A disintegrin and metalloproteinase with thrombospondin motifs 7-like isoform X1 n=1 Tax=Lethenteron reissneri TaxID=7753 RepID=UPI002AB6B091|nr:A disintegrin and metalloproteinase with thrombospondin motifs 7-like isoform X1 [Lethenteron reissneri]